MDFTLTNELLMLRKMYREFAENEIKPLAAEIDEEERFPKESIPKLARYGFLGIPFPKKYGGQGGTNLAYAMAIEELAKCCTTTATIVAAHTSLCCYPIYAYGTEEQKMKYLPDLLSGRKLGAFGLTEPNAGSDASGQQTMAVLEGDHYVLNGTKCFITNGGVADAFIVSAYVDKSKGAAGIAQFFVEKERGVKVGKIEEKMGLHLSVTSEVIFENVRVPMDHMIGSIYFLKPDEAKELTGSKLTGQAAIMAGLAHARISSMVHALGIGQAALDVAVKYAKERRQFGKRIIDHQGLGFLIADMQTKVDAARALLYYSVDCLDQELDTGTLSPSTKVFISDAMMQVTLDAIQVLGGYGYMKDYPVEKLARDIKPFAIFEGTNQIQKIVISGAVLSGKGH